MSSFKFRLQPLVKLRAATRNQRREELAAAYRADQILRQRRTEIESEINAARQIARRQSKPGDIRVDNLLQAHRYELLLSAKIQQIEHQRRQVEAEIERRRQALVEADREMRVLEKLRERQLAEFKYHEQKSEIRELDEIALRRVRAVRERRHP